ncbi:MAG: ferredoxin reductase family protein [Armatimonadota bacterium]
MQSIFWVIGFIIVVLSPLFVLLAVPSPPGRGFWVEFSVALAYAGLAMVGVQMLLTARIRRLSSPFGIDTVYYFHRQISIVAVILILAHPAILFANNPVLLRLLVPWTSTWRTQAGVLALLLLLGLIVASLWRLQLRIPYEPWRATHALAAVGALVLAFWHILAVNYHLNAPWKRELWIALGALWLGALLYTRLIKPFRIYFRPYTVERVIPERGRSWTLVLAPEGHAGVRFRSGQFAWLSIWDSPFDFSEHPFSYSSSAEHPSRPAFTIKALGDFTSRINEVTPGTRVYLDGPYGGFTLDRCPAPAFVFIAGGIGITPIISMLRTLADRRDARPLWLFYANRTWDGVTFREELEALSEQLSLQLIHVIENPPEGWTGEAGVVTRELLDRVLPENRTRAEYYICGPPPMMDAVERHLLALGVTEDHMHAERFNLV